MKLIRSTQTHPWLIRMPAVASCPSRRSARTIRLGSHSLTRTLDGLLLFFFKPQLCDFDLARKAQPKELTGESVIVVQATAGGAQSMKWEQAVALNDGVYPGNEFAGSCQNVFAIVAEVRKANAAFAIIKTLHFGKRCKRLLVEQDDKYSSAAFVEGRVSLHRASFRSTD